MAKRKKPDRNAEFELNLRAFGIGGWQKEYRFAAPDRQWRFDYAFPESSVHGTKLRLAVEIEGLTSFGRRKANCKKCGAPIPGDMMIGRHQTAKGAQEDIRKYERAMLMGWMVYRISQNDINVAATYENIITLIGEQTDERPMGQQGMGLEAKPF